MVNPIERSLRRVDAFQQRHTPTSFAFGVLKKFGDDNGGALVVQLTYAMFTTVFPLLLLVVTVLAIVLAGDPSARHAMLNSTFGQFPVVGTALASNIHVLDRASPFGLAVGLLGLLYGATGLAGTGLYAMEQVWNIDGTVRPNFVKRLARSLVFLGLLGVGLVVTTVLSGFGTFGRHNFWLGVVAEILAAAVNVGLYIGAFRVLTPKQVASHCLLPGAVAAGVAWTIVQALGGYVVGHYLKGDNATYGTFGTVLGLLAWIYLGARITVYAAEVNCVLAGRLWPRAMVQPPLTKADQESIARQVIQNRRRPEQRVTTEVRGQPMTQDEYRDAGQKVDDAVVGTRKVAGAEDAEERPAHSEPTVGADPERVGTAHGDNP